MLVRYEYFCFARRAIVTHLTHFDDSYNFLPYTTNDNSSNRISHIRIAEEDFAQWFLDYRAQVIKVDKAEDNGHRSQYCIQYMR